MSNIITKNSEIPHTELLDLYERGLLLLKKEYDANVNLRAENKQLENQIYGMKNRLKKIFDECKIVL